MYLHIVIASIEKLTARQEETLFEVRNIRRLREEALGGVSYNPASNKKEFEALEKLANQSIEKMVIFIVLRFHAMMWPNIATIFLICMT